MNSHALPFDTDVGSSEVSESGDDGDAAGVCEASIIVDHVYIGAYVPTLLAGRDA